MAVVAAQVAVSTTPVSLSTDPSAGNGSSVLVQAPAAAILYVGGPGVTSAAGFPIPAGQSLSVDLAPFDELFGVLASGTGSATVLRVGV